MSRTNISWRPTGTAARRWEFEPCLGMMTILSISIRVEDMRQVAEEEVFRELADDKIKKVVDKINAYFGW